MKTALSLPDSLFEAAERLARRLKMPRSRLYAAAIERYVNDARRRDITAKLNEVYSTESSELDPVLSAIQEASISRDRW